MAKNQIKQGMASKKRSDTAKIIAELAGCTPAYVRMVMNGDYDNESILTATILFEQGKNKLIQHIEKVVPFNK